MKRLILTIAIALIGLCAIMCFAQEVSDDPCWACGGTGTISRRCECSYQNNDYYCNRCGNIGSINEECSSCDGRGWIRNSNDVYDDSESSNYYEPSSDTLVEEVIELEEAIEILDNVLQEIFK